MNNDKTEYNGFELPENFYFHGNEASQYNFIQVPMPLICEKVFSGISDSAKILYGLLLNRNRLSIQNGWFDSENRTYLIFGIEAVMKELGIGSTKAKKLFKELSDINGTGVGLIKKVRVMNKPSRIYVMNFMAVYAYLKRLDDISADDVSNTDNKNVDNLSENVDKYTDRDFLPAASVANASDGGSQMKPTVSREHDFPSVANATTNKINNKKINNSDIDNNHINTISAENDKHKPNLDRSMDTEKYIDLIKRNIEYEHYIQALISA